MTTMVKIDGKPIRRYLRRHRPNPSTLNITCAGCQPKCAIRMPLSPTTDQVTLEFNSAACKPGDAISWVCCPGCENVLSCSPDGSVHRGSLACDNVSTRAAFEIVNNISHSSHLTIQGQDMGIHTDFDTSIYATCPQRCGGSCSRSTCEWQVPLSDCCFVPKTCILTDATIRCTDGLPNATDIVSEVFSIPDGTKLCDAGLRLLSSEAVTGSICFPEGRKVVRTYMLLGSDGNSVASCQQTFFTPQDKEPPKPDASCTEQMDALPISCGDVVPAATVNDCKFTDNCWTPTVAMQCSLSDSILTRTWTATDGCGLVSKSIEYQRFNFTLKSCSERLDGKLMGVDPLPLFTTFGAALD